MDRGRETSYVEPATALLLSMNNYIRTKAVVSALTGGVVWVGLVLMDIPFAALWGYMFGAVGMLLSVPLTIVIKFLTLSNPGAVPGSASCFRIGRPVMNRLAR